MGEMKSELRSLLDLIENAGFIMTDYREYNNKTTIVIHPGDTAKEKTTGEIISLFESNGYLVFDYCAEEKTRGAVSIKIAPKPACKIT